MSSRWLFAPILDKVRRGSEGDHMKRFSSLLSWKENDMSELCEVRLCRAHAVTLQALCARHFGEMSIAVKRAIMLLDIYSKSSIENQTELKSEAQKIARDLQRLW